MLIWCEYYWNIVGCTTNMFYLGVAEQIWIPDTLTIAFVMGNMIIEYHRVWDYWVPIFRQTDHNWTFSHIKKSNFKQLNSVVDYPFNS